MWPASDSKASDPASHPPAASIAAKPSVSESAIHSERRSRDAAILAAWGWGSGAECRCALMPAGPSVDPVAAKSGPGGLNRARNALGYLVETGPLRASSQIKPCAADFQSPPAPTGWLHLAESMRERATHQQ